ncbi:MAG: hypothetical protein AAF927_13930 [Bacteroidota bacterium]
MKNRFTLQNTTSQRLQNLRLFARGILLSAFVGVLGYEQIEQMRHHEATQHFFFSAKEDNFYENPANWEPEYPGTVIEADARIVIQDLAYLTGYNLKVNGLLEVAMGASLYSDQNDIVLFHEGKLDNHGEIIVNNIRNGGLVFNQMGAKIHVKSFALEQSGSVQNLRSANFIVIDSLVNQGHFLNYSYCAAGELYNHSQFQQTKGSELHIDGKSVELVALYRP